MPSFFIDRLEDYIGNFAGKNILVLGLSYREKVKEHAFSGAFDLVREIESRGATAFIVDPLYSEAEIIKLGLKVNNDISQIDGIVLHTKHDAFRDIDFGEWPKLSAIVDGRSFLDAKKIPDKIDFFSF
jgi:UDP-N-acetyl-D-mannosaminuronate dehydrogenase